MRLGIMQPYFFPYIGYFSLIKNVDKFIILDDVQFIRHGWIERNRILKQAGGWQYIQIPLQKHTQKTLIRDIRVNNSNDWKSRIIAQLSHYKRAPYYSEVISLLEELFEKEYEFITEIDMCAIKKVMEYLNISTPIELFSDMNIDIEPVQAADEWALNICKSIEGVTEYWNPPGGQSFFQKRKYTENGIELCFQQIEISPYRQKESVFEEGLSIIDVMMFNSINEINEMLGRYRLV